MKKPTKAPALYVGKLITEAMHRRDARVLLMRQGWKYLGGGSFAAVFLSPDEQRVVRVGKPDRGYTAQVKAAIEHPRRTHLVRIYGNVQLSCGGLATEMERLQPVCRVANEQTYEEVRAAYYVATDGIRYDIPPKRSLVKAFQLLTSYQGPGEDDRPSTWDLHAGNIMLRGDTPVLTDVLFDERDWEVMRSQDPDGRTAGTGHSARHISQALAEQLPAALAA